MEPVEVVRGFWERIQARDWDGVGGLLAEDVVFEWRHSLERFRGRDNVAVSWWPRSSRSGTA